MSKEKQSEWISVEERLPKNHTTILVYNGNILYVTYESYKKEDRWWTESEGWYTTDELGVTHWMPLPEAPKGGGE